LDIEVLCRRDSIDRQRHDVLPRHWLPYLLLSLLNG
jgi:hypothetical protein